MDRRVAKTKKGIMNAFLELRSKKALEKITVRELCEKAEINKSTFYSHFRDIYDLSEYLETQLADEVVCSLQHPEYLFSKPDVFIRELTYAYIVQENLIHTLFSGSRANMLLIRIEESLKKIIFSLRPEYRDSMTANVLFTLSIYGGFYAFEHCRSFGEGSVIDILATINQKIMEVLQ